MLIGGDIMAEDDKLNKIVGYKAFNQDHTNRYGVLFEEGKTYKTEGRVEFGNNSMGGFHMCKRLEDTLKFWDGLPDPVVAEVEGYGDFATYWEDYNGYYDMFSVENLYIKRFLTREQLLYTIMDDKEMYDDRVCRFVQCIKMNPDEIELFKDHFEDSQRILDVIAYYQEGKKDIYEKKYYKYLKKDY